MADEKKTILKKGPLLNKVVCKVTNGVFSAMDDVIDDSMSENPRAKKFVKRMVHICEDMLYEEFPTSPRPILATTMKISELEAPATSTLTKEELIVGERTAEQSIASRKMFSDGD